MNNIRTAILMAANSIENNPDSYDFSSTVIPTDGNCGCAIGHIIVKSNADGLQLMTADGSRCWRRGLLGLSGEVDNAFVVLGLREQEFYDRMDEFSKDWKESADECVSALRQYVNEYYSNVLEFKPISEALSPSLEGLSLPCALQTRSQG